MAVYTRVETEELRVLLAGYAIGEPVAFSGISAGVTNTNYFVDTTRGCWVLTLFEQDKADQLPFFMQLMDHLAEHGLPCAHPVARNDGGFVSRIADRPAALVHRMDGASTATPSPAQCRALGDVVATMHHAVAGFSRIRRNPRDLEWIRQAAEWLEALLDANDRALLRDEIEFQARAAQTVYAELPTAVVHADLFRDNVLFDGDRVTGLIDFYYACHDYLLLDLAIICNDWAFDEAARYHPEHWQAFMAAYGWRRIPLDAETAAWPAMLRAAALRFWVSRLLDACFPTQGETVQIKDPSPFKQLLRAHRESAPPLLTP